MYVYLKMILQDDFALTASMLEARILELKSLGKTVRAFLLINPNNPLGRNYDQATVEGLLGVCAKWVTIPFEFHFCWFKLPLNSFLVGFTSFLVGFNSSLIGFNSI